MSRLAGCLYIFVVFNVTNHKLLDDTWRKRRLWHTTPRSGIELTAVCQGSTPAVVCRSAAAADTRRPQSRERSERPTVWQSNL